MSPTIIKALTPIIAIVAIATLAGIALANNIDGILFGAAATIIGGLGGYSVKSLISKK